KAFVKHGVSLGLAQALEFVFIVVSQTHVFHCSSPLASSLGSQQHLLADSLIPSSRRCVFRSRSGPTIPLPPSGPAQKRSGAPRPTRGKRRNPCAPTRLPRQGQQPPGSKNRLCAP